MKNLLRALLLILCTMTTGSAFATLSSELKGKVVQRAENPVAEITEGWYVLYNVGRNSCVYDDGSAYKMAAMPAVGTYIPADEKGGLLFHITPAADGKWHITSALGNNVGLTNNNSERPAKAHNFTIGKIGTSTNTFYFYDNEGGYYADGQEVGYKFVGWSTTLPTNASGNSAYRFYPVEEVSAIEVTYHVTATDAQGQNPIAWSFSKFEPTGTLAGLSIVDTYAYVDDYICQNSNGKISASNNDFTFTATHTFPMIPGKKYQIRQTGGDNRYMAAIDGTDGNSNITLRSTCSIDNANTIWSVVQADDAPYFYLVNEARGKSVKAQGGSISYQDTGSAQAQAYEMADGGNGSFKLYVPNQTNNVGAHGHYGGANCSLGLWNSGRDGGTTFIAEEVLPYTINVTGHADGRLIYGGTQYADGTTLYLPLNRKFEASSLTVEGYGTKLAVDGTNVTLRYIKTSELTYTVVYNYVDALTHQPIKSTSNEVRYGGEYPTPETMTGRQLLNAPSGTVSADVELTLYLFDLSSEDHPDLVTPTTVQLTYHVVSPDGTEWYTETVTVNNGALYPALSVDTPYGVTLHMPTGSIKAMNNALDVVIPCTVSTKFAFADSYNNIKEWYFMNIADGKLPLNYNASATQYMTLSSGNPSGNQYLFAFVGNPFAGYTIYNKQAGSTMVLSAPTPRTTTEKGGQDYAIFRTLAQAQSADYNTAWDFKAYGEGYLMARHGESYYANNRNGKLAFWTENYDGGSRIRIVDPNVTVSTSSPATATPTAGKVYRIYSVRSAGYMIYEDASHNLMKTNEKKNDRSQLWVLESSSTSGAYTLRNAETGRFIVAPTGNDAQAVTQDAAAPLYFISKPARSDSNNKPYYGIGGNATGTGNVWLNTNDSNMKVIGYSLGTDVGSGWVIEEATDANLADIKAHVKAISPYASLTTGRYYRLANKAYPTRFMTEDYTSEGKVWGHPSGAMPNDHCQLWQISGDASTGYTFQNVFTRHYIKDQGSQSQQFETTEQPADAKRFLVTSAGETDWNAPQYAFYRSASDKHSLHCAESQKYWVVSWTYENVDASYWNLEPVELSTDEVAAIHQEYTDYLAEKADLDVIADNADAIDAALNTIFADAACTVMRDGFKTLSDYRLRAVLSTFGIPTAIQDMAVCVKNNTWELDPKRNGYTKRFRIHDYMPYSDRDVWANITKTGGFAKFTNPTGITLRNGETATIYVDADPADADAVLGVYVVADTEYNTNARFPLSRGLNLVTAPKDGELIIDYRVTNPDKYVVATDDHACDYPNIRIHIEGGQATGCWDATRNMDNADWQWLCDNAFEAKFLHVKGEMTMLNLLTSDAVQARGERVTAIMQGWDYAFDGLQRMIGHDGQWDGRYRPMINPRHSYGGNPNWGGQGGSNHPTLARNGYLFRESNFTKDNIWEILHEEGHGHQGPINVAGSTEITNNTLSQCVSYELGVNYSRGENGAGHVELFNYQQGDKRGWSWVDYMRYAAPYYDYSLHIGNQMLYRLYLYFKVTGIKPDFMPRLYDELRANGGISKGSSVERPTIWTNDYMKLALACCKVSQTDLSEFFETYGMFKYYEDVMSYREQDDDETAKAQHIRYIGDYGGYYMKMPSKDNPDDVAAMEACIAEMKSYPRKGDNIMFIEDRIKEETVSADALMAQVDPTIVGTPKRVYWNIDKQGDFGQYTDYATPPAASGINYSISSTTATQTVKAVDTGATSTIQGRTVTLTGEGLCGVKIYDKDGKLIYIANTRSFFVPTDVATKLQSGDCTLVVALPDMSSVPLFKGEIGDMNFDGRITVADVAILIKALNVTTGVYTTDNVETLRTNVLR